MFGKRGILTIACAVATIPVFGLLAFSNVHPLVSTLWLGVTYSVAAVSKINIAFKFECHDFEMNFYRFYVLK